MGKIEWIIVMIIVLSGINHFMHFNDGGGLNEIIPYTILLALSYFIAVSLNMKDIRILLILGATETGVLIYELLQGITTVFPSHPDYGTFENVEFLYFMRALGLSENSSVVANKLFVILILADYFGLKMKWDKLLKGILIVGILLTFNRTIIVVTGFYYTLRGIKWLLKGSWEKREAYIGFGIMALIGIILISIVIQYGDVIFHQFTRGQDGIELSGRSYIWNDFGEFIKENSLFGNGSHKLYIRDKYHAHNSYLQVIATHGIFIFILYLLLILFGITWKNIIFIAPLLLYSFTQYGLFWGISIMDIAFLILVCNTVHRQRESMLGSKSQQHEPVQLE